MKASDRAWMFVLQRNIKPNEPASKRSSERASKQATSQTLTNPYPSHRNTLPASQAKPNMHAEMADVARRLLADLLAAWHLEPCSVARG